MNELLGILEEERLMMNELVQSATEQQNALILLKAEDLERIAAHQSELLAALQQKEISRWKYIGAQLGISAKEASQVALSSLYPFLGMNSYEDFRTLQADLSALLSEWQSLNSTNRVLAFRARTSVKEILSFFSESDTRVCNVVV